MVIKRTLALAILIVLAGSAFAKLNLPVKQLGNDKYYYYEVKKNEQISDIAAKIGVSKEDIIKFNPSARNGVAKKQLLFLPVSEFDNVAKPTSQRVNASALNNTVTHVVKNGESVYGIAKAYNITESELLLANPSLSGGAKAGDELIIPNKAAGNIGGIHYHTIQSGETLYGVAKRYNTTIEKIMELNPGISGNNFRANDVIKIEPNITQDIIVKKDIKQFVPYVVAEGDTYESVAKANPDTG